MFRGGVEVSSDGGLDQAIRTTRELVANPEVPAIFEGVFEHQNVLVKVDILQRRRDGRWRLVEVKSSTAVKEQHEDDVAIQYRVVSHHPARLTQLSKKNAAVFTFTKFGGRTGYPITPDISSSTGARASEVGCNGLIAKTSQFWRSGRKLGSSRFRGLRSSVGT